MRSWKGRGAPVRGDLCKLEGDQPLPHHMLILNVKVKLSLDYITNSYVIIAWHVVDRCNFA